MRILHLEKNRYNIESLSKLEKVGKVVYQNFSSQEDYHKHLSENQYQVIFTRLGFRIGLEEMNLQKELTHIVTPTTGLNHIDIDEAQSRGIKVVSLKNEFEFLAKVQSTAEHTWMLLLSLIRNLQPATKDVAQGNWDRVPYLADELNTKTLGIIGLGRLGKILVKYAEAFSMHILCNDIDDNVFEEPYTKYKSSLDKLLENSDYVILQVDYRPENEKFFDSDKFSVLKEGAYFINTSRGEIVDENALLDALESGRLKGAALDVLDGDSSWESTSVESGLIEYSKVNNNLIITPHMGGYGKISIEMTRDFVTDKFLKTI